MAEFYKEKDQPYLEEYGIEVFVQQNSNAGITARAHIHPAIEFIYITQGSFRIGIDNEQFAAGIGDLVLFRANAIHTIRLVGDSAGEYCVLKVNPPLLFQIFQGTDSNSCVIPFLQKNAGDVSCFHAADLPEETLGILQAMIHECSVEDRFFFTVQRAYAATFLISLLRHLIKPRKSYPDSGEISEKSVALIYECVSYVNENYASDITPVECAARIHLSYSYFAKLFRAVVGKTFKEYLTGVRLAKAHNILLVTTLPITDVAASCGYGNLSYFIAEYKKIYGRTPRETRKTIKYGGNE